MTRMTSDIETLSSSSRRAWCSSLVQGLTMVVRHRRALHAATPSSPPITVLVVVPLMLAARRSGSGRRPTTAIDAVRDRIADVLSDLQESLSGVRVVTAYNRQPAQRRPTTATSSATYRDANDYTAAVRRRLRPRHRDHRHRSARP